MDLQTVEITDYLRILLLKNLSVPRETSDVEPP